MRNVSKNNKFSSCFRPVVDIDAVLDSPPHLHRSSSFRFACVPLPHKHHLAVSDTKSVLLGKESPKSPEDSIVHHPPKRTLSVVIKNVVFETILNRRARRQSCDGLKRSYSAYTRTSSAVDEKAILRQASLDSNTRGTKPESPSSSSSSQGSALCRLETKNSSKSQSKKPKHRESRRRRQGKTEKQRRLECYGIYLFLVSLTFTAIWGRYWGAIWTSTWLYFFSLWESSYCHTKEVAKVSKKESQVLKNTGHNGSSARKEVP